jgi:transcriptional regulator with XRE-family HTH domain
MDKTLYTAESLRLATWLKQQRQAKGLTMRQLAEIINEPHSYIGKIEKGLRRLDVVELVWYCEYLGVDPKNAIDAINEDNKNISCNHVEIVADKTDSEVDTPPTP